MTDEEFGRRWAAQQKIDPEHYESGWVWCGEELSSALDYQLSARYLTEGEAFAALGRAVRRINKEVPPLMGARTDEPER
jgi:hypothetical protein